MRLFVLVLLFTMILGCALQKSVNTDLGSNFRLISSASKHDLIIGKWIGKDTYKVYIPGHIADYSYDSIFILAAQRPRDSVHEASYNNPGMTLKKHDQLFNQSRFRQYWIINKKDTAVNGPFKLMEYKEKRNELGVQKNMELKALLGS
jgi:hypothetical protein